LTFCETRFGVNSLETFATLCDLTEVAQALGHPDEAEEFDRRAHEVDDELAAADEFDEGVEEAEGSDT
jgi:hypothetical protein